MSKILSFILLSFFIVISLKSYSQNDCPFAPVQSKFDSLAYISANIPTDPANEEGKMYLGQGYIHRFSNDIRPAFIPSNRASWAIAIAVAWNLERNMIQRVEYPNMNYWMATVIMETELRCATGLKWDDPSHVPDMYNPNTVFLGDHGGCFQIEGPGSAWRYLQAAYPKRFPISSNTETNSLLYSKLIEGVDGFEVSALSKTFYDVYTAQIFNYNVGWNFYQNIDLDQAQKDKKIHIINKLQINEQMNVLDIGCGWGGMAIEIAKQKNCEVTGISLSKNQIQYCKEKAKELGLDNQVKFELIDYREAKGQYDRIYSVGMFEHVGKKFYHTFFKSMNNLLKDNGLFLLHTIGVVDKPTPPNKFINKYIFPGGICPSFSQIITPIEKTGLIVADTETLIRHYDKTLESWLERFLNKKNIVKDLFDEKFVKMWEFYLASCAAAFRYRDLVVFQLQIVKNFQSAHRTRDYIYS